MFKRKKTVHDLKREHLSAVTRTLTELRNKDIENPSDAHDFTPLRSIRPYFSIELSLFDVKYADKDETHRKGYVLKVDPSTLQVVGGSFFTQDGYATYQECELNDDDIHSIQKYFSIPTIQEIVYNRIQELIRKQNKMLPGAA